MASISAIIVSQSLDWNRKKLYAIATLGVGGSFLAALLGANLAAVTTALVMGKTMVWYVPTHSYLAVFLLWLTLSTHTRRFRHEALPILLFGPPATLSVLLFQRLLSSTLRVTPSSLEHATLIGQLIYYTTLLLIGHSFGIGSSYLFALAVFTSILAIVVNDYVLSPRKKNGEERKVHLATYVVLQISPLLLGVEGLVGFLDL